MKECAIFATAGIILTSSWAAHAQTPPSSVEINEAFQVCQQHIIRERSIRTPLPEGVKPGYAPGWESCVKIEKAWREQHDAINKQIQQNKINALGGRLK